MTTQINFIIIAIISGCTQPATDTIPSMKRSEPSTQVCENFAITPDTMMQITGDNYIPLYGKDSSLVSVSDFYLDVYPVTNHQYLQFVNTHPVWRRSLVKDIFADGHYLHNWVNDTSYQGLN